MATIAIRTERFEELLRERGIDSNTNAGTLIGINHSVISRLRTGEAQPGTKFIANALRTFAVPFDELFEIDDEESAA